MPHLHQRVMNKKIKKFAHPKMAVALVGDIPSFIPPGKMPFITHMWKQAQKVPLIPQNALLMAWPMSGLTVKVNKQISNGTLDTIWTGKTAPMAGTQTIVPKRHIHTDVRTEYCIAGAKFPFPVAPMFSISSMAVRSFVLR